YRNFAYILEKERGLEWSEDLYSPGVFRFALDRGAAGLTLGGSIAGSGTERMDCGDCSSLIEEERERRAGYASPLANSAGDFLVAGACGKSLTAGYPWSTDWAGDAFIGLRGLLLARDRLEDARDVLRTWSETGRNGLFPN